MTSYKNNNYCSGFSVMEILLVLFILSVILSVIINFQINIFSYNKISSANLIVQSDARQALKSMSAEIRSMSPSSLGAYPITQADTSSIIFYCDINNDLSKERIRYFLDGTTLKKGIIAPTGDPLSYSGDEVIKELVKDISNATTSIFSYYDENYDGVSDPLAMPINITDISLIKISLIVDENPLKLPAPFLLTTQVMIRNLKNNQ